MVEATVGVRQRSRSPPARPGLRLYATDPSFREDKRVLPHRTVSSRRDRERHRAGRSALAETRLLLWVFAVLTLAASALTLSAARWLFRRWTAALRRQLRGEAQEHESQPILSDVRALIERLTQERDRMNFSGNLGVLAVLASALIGTPGCASSPSMITTTSSHASFDRGKAGSKGAVLSDEAAVAEKVRAAFSKLPGTAGFHFMTTSRGAGYRVSQQENKELFCASTFKVFALAEFLRQAEATPSTVSLTDTIVMSDGLR